MQLRVDSDPAGARIGDRPRGAVHELGRHQLGAHRLGGPRLRVELASPTGVSLEIVGGCLDFLAMDGRMVARAPVAQRDRTLTSSGADTATSKATTDCVRQCLPRSSPVHGCVPPSTAAKSVSITSPRRPRASAPAPFQRPGELTASGVVLDLLVGNRFAEIPHRLFDAGELADGDHRENPCCTSSSVRAKRLQSAYIFAVHRPWRPQV